MLWPVLLRAHLRVLVRRGRSDPPVTGQPNAPPDFSRVEVTEEELNSEVELLKDDDVLRQVAEANNLAAHDWLRWIRPREAGSSFRTCGAASGESSVRGID